MQKYNYPTTILFGEGALSAAVESICKEYKKPLIVTDKTLVKLGFANNLIEEFGKKGIQPVVFDETSPNPTEEDADKGAEVYNSENCDCLVGLGGGSPMDLAKVIGVRATQKGPMSAFDDAKGGDALMDSETLPVNFAIPTTAGTGSEVGRAGVIIVKETGNKTIIFHPKLLPQIAVLEPKLTAGLPPSVTAATGIDAFTHSLEAFFAPGFHPMADGIAMEGMTLVLKHLKTCVENGSDLDARGKMLMAASMGATAFQKGLGMIHAIAHPLSSECGLHHGLANALMLPYCVSYLEQANLDDDQKNRIHKVLELFESHGLKSASTLSECCKNYFSDLGIEFGLKNHGVKESDFGVLAKKALADVSLQSNMISVPLEDLRKVIEDAF